MLLPRELGAGERGCYSAVGQPLGSLRAALLPPCTTGTQTPGGHQVGTSNIISLLLSELFGRNGGQKGKHLLLLH